jgi:hypothetical protein
MTWDDVLALDEDALNLAIEALEGRVWQRYSGPFVTGGWWYVCPAGHPTYSSTPHLHTTASWDHTMEFAFGTGIEMDMLPGDSAGAEIRLWSQEGALRVPRVQAATPHDARLAICRLALWAAQQKETPHADA